MKKTFMWSFGLYLALTVLIYAVSSLDVTIFVDGVPAFDWGLQSAGAWWNFGEAGEGYWVR